MRNTLNSASMIGFNRNDKTIVADRNEFILNRFSGPAHQSFERSRDPRTQHVNLMTDAREFRTGAIVEFAARQDLVCDARHQTVEIAWQIFHQLPQHRRILALRKNRRPRRHRLVAKTRRLQNRQRIETRAFNTQAHDRLSRICQSVEPPFDSTIPQHHAL
jgi:hypothetical protein